MTKITYGGKHSPLLFIDRLVVKLDIPQDEGAYLTHQALFPQFDDPEQFIGSAPPKGGSIMERKIVLASLAQSKHHPHFQYRFAEGQAQWMRLTLHPRDMGLQGFEDLHNILGQFLPHGWGSFVRDGKVTQIETSIDLPGVPFDSVHILPDQTKTYTVYATGQKAETVYLGKSKANQTKIYNRGLKREKLGQYDKAAPCTRIERMKSNTNLRVHQLGKLANPFLHIKFVELPAAPPESEPKPYFWTLFTDSAALRGFDPALKLLPKAKRTAYRKYIASQTKMWWLPSVIWQGWPKILDELKLTDPQFWD